jgi:hypothetical protein
VRAHAHRGIQREAAVFPREHLADILRLDQAAAGEPAQHPYAHLLGDGGDGLRRQYSVGPKAHGLRVSGLLGRLKDAVDDAAMIVNMAVERGTEAVDEAHRPEAGLRAGAAALAQMGLDDVQQDMQYGADRLRLALHLISIWPAQPFGHREDPLAHRQRRDDVIDQVRRGLCHAPGVARRTQAAPFAREGDQEVVPAVRTSGAGEAVGENAALEVTAELPFHVGRHPLGIPVVVPCEREVGLQVLLDHLVEGGSRGMTAVIRGRSASL